MDNINVHNNKASGFWLKDLPIYFGMKTEQNYYVQIS